MVIIGNEPIFLKSKYRYDEIKDNFFINKYIRGTIMEVVRIS